MRVPPPTASFCNPEIQGHPITSPSRKAQHTGDWQRALGRVRVLSMVQALTVCLLAAATVTVGAFLAHALVSTQHRRDRLTHDQAILLGSTGELRAASRQALPGFAHASFATAGSLGWPRRRRDGRSCRRWPTTRTPP
ncbi:MAG: hypothetical protein U0Y82_16415 [Thermoleophilia bacterium]